MLSIPEDSTLKHKYVLKRCFFLTMDTRISEIIAQTFWIGPLGKTGKKIR